MWERDVGKEREMWERERQRDVGRVEREREIFLRGNGKANFD